MWIQIYTLFTYNNANDSYVPPHNIKSSWSLVLIVFRNLEWSFPLPSESIKHYSSNIARGHHLQWP